MLNQITFFVFAVSVIQSIFFAAHWILYKSIVRFFAIENQTVVLYLKIALGLLSLTLVSASYLSFYYYNLPVRLFYNLAAGWLGFLYLFLVVSGILWIFFRNGTTPFFAAILFALAIIVGSYGIWNANNVRITRLNIKLNNLPESWRGKTAVWVSDIHLGQVRGKAFSEQIVKKIDSLNPEIVFVGGDLFDGVAADYNRQTEPFFQLKAPRGVYFITGNHEEFDGAEKFISAAKSANMRELDNQMINIEGIQIIGVDYRDTSNLENFRRILTDFGVDRNRPAILLKHSPYYVEEAAKAGIDFQLSGHTHQGQIFPIQYISHLVFYGYEFGLHKLGNLLVYTSSGAGTWGPPFRLGTKAEIVRITFN